eukprot:TRINITY_DN42007_c0_g1_i1.p1 TRINITY_DN42007_c0_g1~~TRINITY_DN42007_c0_g1_i1.p1  ORF type:complete len:174 (-),score=33.68 TRINITY_DN42007_c0_g1_i1:45-566(-)
MTCSLAGTGTSLSTLSLGVSDDELDDDIRAMGSARECFAQTAGRSSSSMAFSVKAQPSAPSSARRPRRENSAPQSPRRRRDPGLQEAPASSKLASSSSVPSFSSSLCGGAATASPGGARGPRRRNREVVSEKKEPEAGSEQDLLEMLNIKGTFQFGSSSSGRDADLSSSRRRR